MRRLAWFFLLGYGLLLLSITPVVLAADPPATPAIPIEVLDKTKIDETIKGGLTTEVLTDIKTTDVLFGQIINFILGFVGTITLLMMILGGYYYITAQGEEAQMEKGKKIIIGGIIGMIIIVGSYTIVSTVLNLTT